MKNLILFAFCFFVASCAKDIDNVNGSQSQSQKNELESQLSYLLEQNKVPVEELKFYGDYAFLNECQGYHTQSLIDHLTNNSTDGYVEERNNSKTHSLITPNVNVRPMTYAIDPSFTAEWALAAEFAINEWNSLSECSVNFELVPFPGGNGKGESSTSTPPDLIIVPADSRFNPRDYLTGVPLFEPVAIAIAMEPGAFSNIIVINSVAGSDPCAYDSPGIGGPLSGEHLELCRTQVMVHEIGHIMGLMHTQSPASATVIPIHNTNNIDSKSSVMRSGYTKNHSLGTFNNLDKKACKYLHPISYDNANISIDLEDIEDQSGNTSWYWKYEITGTESEPYRVRIILNDAENGNFIKSEIRYGGFGAIELENESGCYSFTAELSNVKGDVIGVTTNSIIECTP